MAETDDAQWAEFEKAGETAVRQNLAARRYGEGKLKLAEAWLAHLAQVRLSDAASHSASSNLEQIRIARSAKNAAWAAAIAAIIAAICAIIAISLSKTPAT